MTLEVDFKFPDWPNWLKHSEGELNLFQAAQIQTNRGLLFDAEGGRNGNARWPTLKFRAGQILSNRGALRKSLAPFNPRGQPGPSGIVRFTENAITVGTKLMYARMMNDGTTKMPGGVLRAKKAKALRIPLPAGENATQTAKDLRANGSGQVTQEMEQRYQKAQDRAIKARIRFQTTGNPKAMASSIRAEEAVHSAYTAINKKRSKPDLIKNSGRGGRGFIFVNSVRIPARRFDQWTQADQDELDNALKTKLVEILNG